MHTLRTLGAVGTLAALAFITSAASPSSPAALCEISFDPAAVAVQEEPVQVRFALTESIGEIVGASADRDSGIEVLRHDAMLQTLDLNTAGANPGDWNVTLAGEGESTCTGRLTVSGGS